jgi:hypothetical protein
MAPELTELGLVIASRKLSFDRGREITIRIGQPFVPSDYGGNFCCPYQIVGLGDEKIRHGSGIDSLQSLYLALINISTDLYTSDEAQAGQIMWQGERDLGLPYLEAIKEFVPKRDGFCVSTKSGDSAKD